MVSNNFSPLEILFVVKNMHVMMFAMCIFENKDAPSPFSALDLSWSFFSAISLSKILAHTRLMSACGKLGATTSSNHEIYI